MGKNVYLLMPVFLKSKSVHDPGHNFKVNISQDGVHMSKNPCDIEGMLEDS